MLSRPTTAQILEDCRRELTESVGPAVGDETVAVTVSMLDEVLGNCAVRAAHEIAWMAEESTAAIDFAREVAAGAPGSAALDGALARHDTERTGSLHLEDVCADYNLASQCLSEAIDVALASDHEAWHRQARHLLDQRLTSEDTIKGDWGFVGRG